jgi:hypothetical protein
MRHEAKFRLEALAAAMFLEEAEQETRRESQDEACRPMRLARLVDVHHFHPTGPRSRPDQLPAPAIVQAPRELPLQSGLEQSNREEDGP